MTGKREVIPIRADLCHYFLFADHSRVDTIFVNTSAFVGTNPNGGLITTEQGTAARCQWCQKLLQSEMLTWTWLGS